MSSFKYFVLLFVVILGFSGTRVLAVEQVSQVVTLAEGWNTVSTPMVLESHEFSAPESAENFDIYMLDATHSTGWATMADLGQTEFTPLYGYFINNKTDSVQTLTFNYDTALKPNEKFFQRTFAEEGWYSIGVANDEYAKDQSADKVDTDNPSKILSLMTGSYDLVVDFTNADYMMNRRSVAVSDPWKMVVPIDIDSLNDFRETKGYAVYIKEGGVKYIGAQNDPAVGDVTDQEDELIVFNSTNDPDATTLLIENDSESEWHTVFVFGLDSGNSDDDIEIASIPIQIELSASSYAGVIDAANLVIGGVTYDNFTVSDAASASPILTFDLDSATLYSGEKMEVELKLRFKALDFENQGMTVQASINNADDIVSETIEADQISGTAVGKAHTLVAEGILVPVDGFSSEVDTLGTNDTIGEFTLEFEVTAIEGDFYITDNASTSATDGVTFTVDGTIGTGSVSASLTSSADEDTAGVFTVREGETETFTLVVTVDPQNTGTFKVALDGIWYSTNELGTGGDEYVITNASDFDTAPQSIQGS